MKCGYCEYPGGSCENGCPNYAAPIIAQCCKCGCDLHPGDRVFEIPDGAFVCWECVEDESYVLEMPEPPEKENIWEDI